MKIRKAIRQVLDQYGIPSQAVSKTRGNHLRIELNHTVIFTSSTPSDPRTVKNLAAQIKRGA